MLPGERAGGIAAQSPGIAPRQRRDRPGIAPGPPADPRGLRPYASAVPRLTVNGTPREVASETLAGLLEELGLAGRPVAAERNGAVVPKKEHASTAIEENDTLELVTLVGGG